MDEAKGGSGPERVGSYGRGERKKMSPQLEPQQDPLGSQLRPQRAQLINMQAPPPHLHTLPSSQTSGLSA